MLQTLAQLTARFEQLGATTVFCKPLAENDNSKNQVYLGGSLDALQMFPFAQSDALTGAQADSKTNTFKVKLNFFWIGTQSIEAATGAQLIVYPQYPEVRLSGFLRGCKTAPNELMQPPTKGVRKFNNASDGRILFFGITQDGRTLAYLAAADSAVANEFFSLHTQTSAATASVFYKLSLVEQSTRTQLLEALCKIHFSGAHASMRLDKAGKAMPYLASNGGGYTLEALLGIIPNGRSEPDYKGWEIKGFSKNILTLMTPEPNGGEYFQNGVRWFVNTYGHKQSDSTNYFTGMHRCSSDNSSRNATTGLTLALRGFDAVKNKITDVNGAVELLTDAGICTAAWSFSGLMTSWNKKHAQAAYIKYSAIQKDLARYYQYQSPIWLGEGTDFVKYLQALSNGLIGFDPASKVTTEVDGTSRVKARSQFRITQKHLHTLYAQFAEVPLKNSLA
jgi:MvaI/BcnI restriction endonuclease family